MLFALSSLYRRFIVAAVVASHPGLLLQQGSILEGAVLHCLTAIPRLLCYRHSRCTESLCCRYHL